MIKTTNSDQTNIIADILKLHCNNQQIELDATYSKGVFYKNRTIPQPKIKIDLHPQTDDTIKARAENLPIKSNFIYSIIFDPPFIVGHTKQHATGIIGKRFNSFRYISDLWEWYDNCLIEFHRVLIKGGVLIFKCQDTVSSGKQWWSHIHITTQAEKNGFYMKDLFILLANNRIQGHNHKNQKHARKFHSYFLVFEKK